MNRKAGESKSAPARESDLFFFGEALHHALKMFAELLHEPLFTQDASARELQAPRHRAACCLLAQRQAECQAIESEFQKKRRSDTRLDSYFLSDLFLDLHWLRTWYTLARWQTGGVS